jgi:polysaccharide export outer membrane protein
MRNIVKRILFYILPLSLLFSCASKKEILLLQDIEEQIIENERLPVVIKPGDRLYIHVNGQDPKIAAQFNLPIIQQNRSISLDQPAGISNTFLGYIVDENFEIDFPIIGTTSVKNLNINQIEEKLKSKIKDYLPNPVITIRLTNFSITLLGEVKRPGKYNVNRPNISIIEAIGLAGGLDIKAERENVLIIREIDGKRVTKKINLLNAEFIASEYFFLQQNDVIYIQPNKTKINSSRYGPEISVIISITSTIIALISVINSTTK